jgi:glycerate 2-kinase
MNNKNYRGGTTTFLSASRTSLPDDTRNIHINTGTDEGTDGSTNTNTDTIVQTQTENEVQMTKDALIITQAAINAVDPKNAIEKHLSYNTKDSTFTLEDTSTKKQHVYKLGGGNVDNEENKSDSQSQSSSSSLPSFENIIICAFGKAATDMALKTAQILSPSNIPIQGIVITKHDHATQEQINDLKNYNIDLHFASHPIPDEQSIICSKILLDMVQSASSSSSSASSRTLLLNCISGGGSALFCTPRNPLSLTDMAQVNEQLLACGMPITEMNIIRKKLEIGKGGGLVGLAYPATSVTMVLSDVIGDPLDLIASGPSVPDQSTWDDAWELVERYRLNRNHNENNNDANGGENGLPQKVLDILKDGKDGKLDVQDLPTIDHPMFTTICDQSESGSKLSETVLVGNNAQAVAAAAEEAQRLGYNPVVLGTTIEGEAMHIANMYVSMAEQVQLQRTNPTSAVFPFVKLPAALIAGGETTVTLSKNHGKGGRNQEIGLAAALRMKSCGLRDIVLASVGTDGTDGPTDAAGSVVDGITIDRVESSNGGTMSGKDALEQHDAYNFFDSSNDSKPLVKTGPTGTNVADICVSLIQ